MIKTNIGTEFKIDTFDKCATSEWIYLALKSGKFDDKLAQSLDILHKKEKFLNVENIDDFKKIIFWEINLTQEEKELYKNLIKSVFTWPNKIFNGDFVKLLQEVIEKYLFIRFDDSSEITTEMRNKVSVILAEIETKNIQNVNPLSYWTSDFEFFSYVFSKDQSQELTLKYSKDIINRLNKNPEILKSFCKNEEWNKKIFAILEKVFWWNDKIPKNIISKISDKTNFDPSIWLNSLPSEIQEITRKSINFFNDIIALNAEMADILILDEDFEQFKIKKSEIIKSLIKDLEFVRHIINWDNKKVWWLGIFRISQIMSLNNGILDVWGSTFEASPIVIRQYLEKVSNNIENVTILEIQAIDSISRIMLYLWIPVFLENNKK